MCKFSILFKNKNGIIRYCHDCNTYNLNYKNIVMNFDEVGFTRFKENVSICYEENLKMSSNPHLRDIFFNTKVEGLLFVFSITEVGELLSMIQAADFEIMGLTEFEKNER